MNAKNSEENEQFFKVPYFILPLKNISSTEKLLYAVILSYSKKRGYAYASNPYLAKLLSCSLSTVSNGVSKLEKCGLISIENRQSPMRKLFIVVNFLKNSEVTSEKSKKNSLENSAKSRENAIHNREDYINNKEDNKEKSLRKTEALESFTNNSLEKDVTVDYVLEVQSLLASKKIFSKWFYDFCLMLEVQLPDINFPDVLQCLASVFDRFGFSSEKEIKEAGIENFLITQIETAVEKRQLKNSADGEGFDQYNERYIKIVDEYYRVLKQSGF